MPELAHLLPFLLLGLGGSVHCVGMCGVFAVAAGAGCESRTRSTGRQALFVAGKTCTYLACGAALVLLVQGLGGQLGTWSGSALQLQAAMAWAAGAVMIVTALSGLGLIPVARLTRWIPWRPFRSLFAAARATGGGTAAFATGMVTGLLPCGLSWSAFALATQVPPSAAIGGLIAFGLGTGPALAAVGGGWGAIPIEARARLARVVAVALLAFGGWTVMRGVNALEAAEVGTTAPCCAESGTDHGSADVHEQPAADLVERSDPAGTASPEKGR